MHPQINLTCCQMPAKQRDEMTSTAFFRQAVNGYGLPENVVMDKSGPIYAGLSNINPLLILADLLSFIEILQVKYLNDRTEQDHRFIKKIAQPMTDFKSFHSADVCVHLKYSGNCNEVNQFAYMVACGTQSSIAPNTGLNGSLGQAAISYQTL